MVVDKTQQQDRGALAAVIGQIGQADASAFGQGRGVVPAHTQIVERQCQQASIRTDFDRHRIGIGDGEAIDQGCALADQHADASPL